MSGHQDIEKALWLQRHMIAPLLNGQSTSAEVGRMFCLPGISGLVQRLRGMLD